MNKYFTIACLSLLLSSCVVDYKNAKEVESLRLQLDSISYLIEELRDTISYDEFDPDYHYKISTIIDKMEYQCAYDDYCVYPGD